MAKEQELRDCVAAVAGRRDRAAFARLFQHFAPRLKAYARRAGVADDVAEELAQEAMIQVWRKAGTFDPKRAAVSTWVFTIARNKRIDRLRREARPDLEEADYRFMIGEGNDPLETAQVEQEQERLAKLVAALPNDQAEVVRMAFYEDKSHVEIAEALELPLGTVKSRVRLALSKLRIAVSE